MKYVAQSATQPDTLNPHIRRAVFHGESPTEKWFGEIVAMRLKDGQVSLTVDRKSKKYDGKNWHSQSIYATVSADVWAHLLSLEDAP